MYFLQQPKNAYFPSRRSAAQRKLTYVVPHEEIIRIGRLATNPEQLDEIMKLPVDVPAHRYGAFHRLHVPLFHDHSPCLLAEGFHLRLRQELALLQVLDLKVKIRIGRHRCVKEAPSTICERPQLSRTESSKGSSEQEQLGRWEQDG